MRPFRSTICSSFLHRGQFRRTAVAQQKVLLFGIVFALVARTGFIFLGAALMTIFDWAFYLFGIVLLLMAANLAKRSGSEGHSPDTLMIRIARRLSRTSDNYDGDRLFAVENGRRVMTPMLAGDDRCRRGGRVVRVRLDPGAFRAVPERLAGVLGHRVVAVGLAPVVLSDRRSARPAGVPVLRPGGDLGVHRREPVAAGLARQQHSVHQRRPPGPGRRSGHDDVVDGDRRHPGHHHGGVVAVAARPAQNAEEANSFLRRRRARRRGCAR